MSKTYYKEYSLLKDTPTKEKGWPLRWDGTRRKYYYPKPSTWGQDKGKPDMYLDYDGESFTIEQVEASSDWFKPKGEPTEYVPAFPSEKDIDEYVNLNFETNLVDSVDVCRAMNDLFRDKEFQKELYYYVKYKYEKKHNIEETKQDD